MPPSPIIEELRTRAVFLGLAWVALICCFVLVQPAQFIDPFSWSDDVLWEFAPGFYITKLREEGRWLVFGWYLAFGLGSPAFDYKLLIAIWCATALGIAVAAAGTRRPFVPLLAAALAISPSLWALTLWPHTVLPMVAILAVCGSAVALARDERSRFRALFVAMVATVLSYQLFSFYLLGALLVVIVLRQAESRDPLPARRLASRVAVLVGVGAAGMIAGVVAQYGLNALAFGRFGLEQAGWRAGEADALRAGSRPELVLANLRLNLSWLNEHMMGRLSLVGLTAAAALVMGVAGSDAGRRRRLLLYAAVMAAVAAAPLAIPFATGIILPADRGSLNLWLGLVGVLALAFMGSVGVAARRIAVGGLLLLIASSVQSLSLFSATFERHREQNVAVLNQLATQVGAGVGGPHGPVIHFVGPTRLFEGPAGDSNWFGAMLIRHKFDDEKGELVFCIDINGCPRLAGLQARLAAMPSFPVSGSVVANGDVIVVKLGPSAVAPPTG